MMAINTPITLVRFKPRFSAVLRVAFVGGKLRLSRGRSQKVYVLIAVNTVYSRYLRFPAVLCGSATAEKLGLNRTSVKVA